MDTAVLPGFAVERVVSSGPNTPPVANDDLSGVDENVVLMVPAPGVLGNDSDPDSNPLTAIW